MQQQSFAFCLVLALSVAFTVGRDTNPLNKEEVGEDAVEARAVVKKDLSNLNATEQQVENITVAVSKVEAAYTTTTSSSPERGTESATLETAILESKNKTYNATDNKPAAAASCETSDTKQQKTNGGEPKFHGGGKLQIIVPTQYPYTTKEPQHYQTSHGGDYEYGAYPGYGSPHGNPSYPGYGGYPGYPGYGAFPGYGGYPGVGGFPGFGGYPVNGFNSFNGFNGVFPFFVPVGMLPNSQFAAFFNPFIPGFQNRNFGSQAAKLTKKPPSSTESPIATTTASVKQVVKEQEPIPSFLRLFG